MTGKGYPHHVTQHRMVACGECGQQLVATSMYAKIQTYHGRSGWARPLAQPLTLPRTKKYWVDFLQTAKVINCLVEVCPGRMTRRNNPWSHFMHPNVEDTIVVLNQGPIPDPRCRQQDIFIPRQAMQAEHLDNAMCKGGGHQLVISWDGVPVSGTVP